MRPFPKQKCFLLQHGTASLSEFSKLLTNGNKSAYFAARLVLTVNCKVYFSLSYLNIQLIVKFKVLFSLEYVNIQLIVNCKV